VSGVDDHRRLADRGVAAELPEKLEAVHDGHEHIGDDEIRPIGADDRQRFAPVRGLEEPVSVRAQQRDQVGPVRGEIVNDQDRLDAKLLLRAACSLPFFFSFAWPERDAT
jgi:hypothetical protein